MKSHCYSSHGIPITKRILLAWAAGFFDGEGYVGVRSNGKSGKFLAASVAQKDRRLLKRFQLIVERGNIGKPAKSSGVSYLTFTNSPDVLVLYELIAPYLGPQKTEQFQRAFIEWFAYRRERGRTKG